MAEWGEARVFCDSEQIINDYELRELSFSWKGQTPRKVYQYHFMAWPDHGVPSDPGCVLNFFQEVNKHQEKLGDENPVSFFSIDNYKRY